MIWYQTAEMETPIMISIEIIFCNWSWCETFYFISDNYQKSTNINKLHLSIKKTTTNKKIL